MHGIGSVLLLGSAGKWLLRLGRPGLIVIGLIDNSVIPIPGGMDLFVILLSSHHREWWWYYGLMGTAGAVLGGYVTFRLSKKGGKEGMEKKIGKQRAEKVYKKFEKAGLDGGQHDSLFETDGRLRHHFASPGSGDGANGGSGRGDHAVPKKEVPGGSYAGPGSSLFWYCGSRKAVRHRDLGLAQPLLQTFPLRPDRSGSAGWYRRVGVLQVVSPKAPAQLKRATQSRVA